MIRKYKSTETCTSAIAADIIDMSEDTAKRRLAEIRKTKNYRPRFPISVGEFCDFYHIRLS